MVFGAGAPSRLADLTGSFKAGPPFLPLFRWRSARV